MSCDPRRPIVVVFGEVLFDRFPDGTEVLGGAPFNVAWNLHSLGAEPHLVSRVGDDELGERVLTGMAQRGLRTYAVQIDRQRPTGTVEVSLHAGEPSFDIVSDRAYDAIDGDLLPAISSDALLYHGTLACRAERSRKALGRLVRRRPGAIFFDVNLRAPWWEGTLVTEFLDNAHEIKLNEDELERLVPGSGAPVDRARDLCSQVGAERLYLTRGVQGAIALSARSEPVEVKPAAKTRVVDTVGAGDAFSSVLILGRIKKWPLPTTLQRAQEFAAAVVGLRGATTAERLFYEQFTAAWGSG